MAITEYVNPVVHEGDDLVISKAGNGGFTIFAHPCSTRGGFASTTPFAASTAADMLAMLALFYGVTPNEIANAVFAIECRLPKERIYAAAAVVSGDPRIKDRPE